MKKIVVVFGHPLNDSFCAAIKDAYCDGAKNAGAEIREINLAAMTFDPILHNAYKTIQTLEPDLVEAQKKIEWADHVVMIYPLWWGGMPAKLKGFIDRAFHPTWAFTFAPDALRPTQLLKGRSGGVIITIDNLPILFRWVYGKPAIRQMRQMVLNFCGIKPVWTQVVGSIKLSSDAKRAKWLRKAHKQGEKDAR